MTQALEILRLVIFIAFGDSNFAAVVYNCATLRKLRIVRIVRACLYSRRCIFSLFSFPRQWTCLPCRTGSSLAQPCRRTSPATCSTGAPRQRLWRRGCECRGYVSVRVCVFDVCDVGMGGLGWMGWVGVRVADSSSFGWMAGRALCVQFNKQGRPRQNVHHLRW